MSIKVINADLLKGKGLQATTNENGEVVISEYEEPVTNGGKWMPEYGDTYYTPFEDYNEETKEYFDVLRATFRGLHESFITRKLAHGLVFPTKEQAELFKNKMNEAYKQVLSEIWDAYDEA